MDVIQFQCPSCDKEWKVPVDKAGRRVQCSKCGNEMTVPAPSVSAGAAKEDDKGGYGFFVDPAQAAAEAAAAAAKAKAAKSKKEKKILPKIKRRIKTIQEPEAWRAVRAGLNLVLISIYLWAGTFALRWIVVVLGLTQGPEYSEVAEKILTIPDQPPPEIGARESADLAGFLIGLISGYEFYGVGKALFIVAAVLSLGQAGLAIAGYGMCTKVPDRFGMRGQILALFILAGVNILLNLIFRLLPATGAMNYALVPWYMPELPMIDSGAERSIPVHIFWCKSGFWEMLLSILVMFCYYAEPVMIGVFLWSIGLFFKEPPAEEAGFGVVQITMGVAFALLGYQLISTCGTSPVLQGVLRVGYCIWVLFTIILLVRFVMAIFTINATITKYLEAADEAEEEGGRRDFDDDDDEEDDEERPRRARKKKRRNEDDDD